MASLLLRMLVLFKRNMDVKGTKLDNVLIIKYLSINIDSCLNLKDSISTTSSIIAKVIGFLNHTKICILQDALRGLYTGCVELQCCRLQVMELFKLQKFQTKPHELWQRAGMILQASLSSLCLDGFPFRNLFCTRRN